jgi:hypothetical protein
MPPRLVYCSSFLKRKTHSFQKEQFFLEKSGVLSPKVLIRNYFLQWTLD